MLPYQNMIFFAKQCHFDCSFLNKTHPYVCGNHTELEKSRWLTTINLCNKINDRKRLCPYVLRTSQNISFISYLPDWFTCPKTVTHPGTNRARRVATALIGRKSQHLLTIRPPRHQLSAAGGPAGLALCISGPVSASSTSVQMVSVNYTTTTHQSSQALRMSDARSQMLTRRNVAKMLIAVVVMFGVCFLPVHLLNILRSFTVYLFVLFCLFIYYHSRHDTGTVTEASNTGVMLSCAWGISKAGCPSKATHATYAKQRA